MSTPILLGRPPERTSEIVRELRGRITDGRLAPGVQLPTRVAIEKQFGASSGTVQRALQELQRDGFVTVLGRQGTFVSTRPPHLTNYALVFPSLPGDPGWTRFYAALNYEAPGLGRTMGRQISMYYGAEGGVGHGDTMRLMADAKALRIGGIIFAAIPRFLSGTPAVEELQGPRVAIMTPSTRYGMSQVCPDSESMWERSAAYLLGKGRSNLAILLPPYKAANLEEFRRRMLSHGFNVPPQWVQGAPRDFPELARNLMHLLFEGGRNQPDALFITDDNLVEHALAGLIAAGVRVPEDVEVVAHCNFPHPVVAPVPVKRLGFDARQVLQACFDDLDRQRSGQTTPGVTYIPAAFEEEIGTQANRT